MFMSYTYKYLDVMIESDHACFPPIETPQPLLCLETDYTPHRSSQGCLTFFAQYRAGNESARPCMQISGIWMWTTNIITFCHFQFVFFGFWFVDHFFVLGCGKHIF